MESIPFPKLLAVISALEQFRFSKYWFTSVISALGKQRQEDQEFKVSLDYTESSKLAA